MCLKFLDFNFPRFFCFFFFILFERVGFVFLWNKIELVWSIPRPFLFLFWWLFNSQYFPVKLDKQRHVFGGRTHFPPFKHGGEQIAEKIYIAWSNLEVLHNSLNYTLEINAFIAVIIKLPFLQFLPEYPNWQSQVFGAIHLPPFRQPPLHLAKKERFKIYN